MPRYDLAICIGFMLMSSAWGSDGQESPGEFFTNHIEPILIDSCIRCHGPTRQRSGLRLDSLESVMRGGHSAIVVPGDPTKSRLLDALAYDDVDLQMPPDGKLTDAEIADFTAWVRLGVPWGDTTIISSVAHKPSIPANHVASTPTSMPKAASSKGAGRRTAVFIGRLHPMVVHFPIALLVLSSLSELGAMALGKSRYAGSGVWLRHAAVVCLVAGAITSTVAVTLGWTAYWTNVDNQLPLALWHGWMGTVTAVLALTTCSACIGSYLNPEARWRRAYQILVVLLLPVIGVTGHLGASLVYGIHYLF